MQDKLKFTLNRKNMKHFMLNSTIKFQSPNADYNMEAMLNRGLMGSRGTGERVTKESR